MCPQAWKCTSPASIVSAACFCFRNVEQIWLDQTTVCTGLNFARLSKMGFQEFDQTQQANDTRESYGSVVVADAKRFVRTPAVDVALRRVPYLEFCPPRFGVAHGMDHSEGA